MSGCAQANGRAVSLLMPDEPLACPRGHEFKKDFWTIGEDPSGGTRCKYVPPPPRGGARDRALTDSRSSASERHQMGLECGLLVYWMLLPGGTRIVVEVSSRELHEMERARMTVGQIRNFLGLRWLPERAA